MLLCLAVSGFALGQDELPAVGQPTPWLDIDSVSTPVVSAPAAPPEENLKGAPSKPRYRMTPKEVLFLNDELEPGDIILVRRDPLRGGMGLPGYWNEALLYLGTPQEREHFFGGKTLDLRLKNRYPTAYRAAAASVGGYPARVLRTARGGSAFASLEEALRADACAALRPRVSKVLKAEAVFRVFAYAGLPYDSDSLTQAFGRPAASADDLAREFDEEFGLDGEARHWDLVWFIENRSGRNRATRSGAEEFRRSWRRPARTVSPGAEDDKTAERSP